MSFEVRLQSAAQKELNAIPDEDYRKIAEAISGLEENPYPRKVKKLKGSELWRVRVGNYRIVYVIDKAAGSVIIVRVARRQEDT
jgi:mRNA interferase RelE/StbE